MTIRKEVFLTPIGIFWIYQAAAILVIMIFRFLFPGEAAPLAHFAFSWRLTRGLLAYIDLFPALSFTAFVIPFGFQKKLADDGALGGAKINPFSSQFFDAIKKPVICTIMAAVIFGLLFSLVLPLVREREASLRYRGRLYGLAGGLAKENAELGRWEDTAQFLAVCERIWPNGPDVAKIKIESDIRNEQRLFAKPGALYERSDNAGAGPQPLSATEALALAEAALGEERFFDAHWLATLGGRLAGPGSAETALASRLAGRAWNGVNSLAPNINESRAFNIYRLKREGYDALLAQDWIRAYYIFYELSGLSPDDPDTVKYFAMSEDGVKQLAFFIDEVELTMGSILTGAVFSLPVGNSGGRLVMRVSSLSTSSDSAYGMGLELIAFDGGGRPVWSMAAPYAKFSPVAPDSSPLPSMAILFRALDRADKNISWEPSFLSELGAHSLEIPAGRSDAALALSVSWEDFLLLSGIHRGIKGLSVMELRNAADRLGDYGYQREVFEAELLRRFTEPLFFLPMAIFALIMGWRYRALRNPRYMGVPMLGILPLVFYGIEYFSLGWINNLGIYAVVSVGLTAAAIFFGTGILVLFILSLIMLAAQHS